ncbi:hypothetical protein AOLI_G00300980 [Acnodon oligacanthus]
MSMICQSSTGVASSYSDTGADRSDSKRPSTCEARHTDLTSVISAKSSAVLQDTSCRKWILLKPFSKKDLRSGTVQKALRSLQTQNGASGSNVYQALSSLLHREVKHSSSESVMSIPKKVDQSLLNIIDQTIRGIQHSKLVPRS